MSTPLAIVAVMLVFAFVLTPLALAGRKWVRGAPVALGYGALVVAVGAYHTDLGGERPIASIDTGAALDTVLSSRQCSELIAALEEARVIVDRRNRSRLVVGRALWEQLPREAQDAAVTCVGRDRSGAAAAAPLEVVLQ